MKPFHEWIGFDMDHALVRYKLEALYPLIFDCLRTYLVNNVPEYKSLQKMKFDVTFCQKGVIFDMRTGDFIKLDEAGRVISACHGNQSTCSRRRSLAAQAYAFALPKKLKHHQLNRMTGGWFSRKTIREKYNSKSDHWDQLDALQRQEKDAYMQFLTYFDIPAAQLVGELVQITDTQAAVSNKRIRSYRHIMKHMGKAFNACFGPEHFSDGTGGYFSALRAHTDRYVEAADAAEIKKQLAHLRTTGTKIALITNSHVDYSELLMRFSFGRDWRQMFDIVVFYARKGNSFFKKNQPFRNVKEPEITDDKRLIFSNEPGEETHQLALGGSYIGGSSQGLKQLMGNNAAMLYIGDNVKSDIFIPKMVANWEVVAIVEECADDRGRQPCSTLRPRPFLAHSRWDCFFTCFHVGPPSSPKTPKKKSARRSPSRLTPRKQTAKPVLSCETTRSWTAGFLDRHADGFDPSVATMLRQYCARRKKHMWTFQRRHIANRFILVGTMGLATLAVMRALFKH